MLTIEACTIQIFRKEPFFYGHDNSDQLVKIAKVGLVFFGGLCICFQTSHSFMLKQILADGCHNEEKYRVQSLCFFFYHRCLGQMN